MSIAPRVSMRQKNDVAVFTDIDDATMQMLGWTRAKMIGRASLEFVHPDDHDRAIESWMDMLSNRGISAGPGSGTAVPTTPGCGSS